MAETIKMHGRLLLFDVVDECNYCVPKSCDVRYPERVPFLNKITDYNNGKAVIGNATIHKDEIGLVCDVILYEPLEGSNLHIGGIFIGSVSHDDNGVRVFDRIDIWGVGITNAPASDEYRLSFVDDYEASLKEHDDISEQYEQAGQEEWFG